MTTKIIAERQKSVNIRNTDDIKFVLSTTDADGCLQTPYKINQVTIYFISREFASTNSFEYENRILDSENLDNYDAQKQITCDSPTAENISKLATLKKELDDSTTKTPFYFKESIPVKIWGGYVNETGELFPAWINPTMVPPSEVDQITQDNMLTLTEEGKFSLNWDASELGEGDYFICWNWNPSLSGNALAAHMLFQLKGNTQQTCALPTHFTDPEKYPTLMERYLPEMFKTLIAESDLTPYVLQELNASVGDGFEVIEDMANQIIDLLDSNTLQTRLLPLLSNTFNLNLKSNDITLWRRQIKKAIPNFKQKGTFAGLKSALGDAGIKLLKVTRLWQINSKYTYQENFEKVQEDVDKFTLSKNVILPIDPNNFSANYRPKDSNDWQSITQDYVNIQLESDGSYSVTWTGDTAPSPIALEVGDSFRVRYQIKQVPSPSEQSLEDYIISLNLMDLRDERLQDYPPKNWNTRVLEEDDPLFNVLIPITHPITDDIVWGKVRTEFPYSENVYNMEEYNGSTRDSYDPCDIEKEFMESCGQCQGSKINVDVEIEELSEDRILEAQRTIEEYIPFHSMIHSINFVGSVHEFVTSPVEVINSLITNNYEDSTISGNAQFIFNRAIPPEQWDSIKRNVLATMSDRTGTVTGTGYNNKILLYCPSSSTTAELENYDFKDKVGSFIQRNINETDLSGTPSDNSNILEILSPSANQGTYSVSNVQKDMVEITVGTVSEPIDTSQFEFRISNKIFEESSVDITQDDQYIFSCGTDLSPFGIVSQKDIDDGVATGPVWEVNLEWTPTVQTYTILEILPDGTLLLSGSAPISSTVDVWQLIEQPTAAVIAEGTTDGSVATDYKAIVDFDPSGTSTVTDIRNHIKIGDYLSYGSYDYKIKSFLKNETHKFYIETPASSPGYPFGLGGVAVKIYRRIIENAVGRLGYDGLRLETAVNYESSLPIQNGTNAIAIKTLESEFKENYLILIGSDYYSITDIDGTTITLNGPNDKIWQTTGTSVDFTIYQFINQPLSIQENPYPVNPGHDFEEVVRSDNEVITNSIESSVSFLAAKALNNANELSDSTTQNEGVNFKIEYQDGTSEEGKI